MLSKETVECVAHQLLAHEAQAHTVLVVIDLEEECLVLKKKVSDVCAATHQNSHWYVSPSSAYTNKYSLWR